MATNTDTKLYQQWVNDRADLTPIQRLVLNAATRFFILAKQSPKPFGAYRPPTTYAQWLDEREQLTLSEATAIDAVMKDLLKANTIIEPIRKPVVSLPQPIITPSDQPLWWQKERVAAISLGASGTQQIIPQRTGYTHFVTAIIISVTDETDIFFSFGSSGATGSLSLGGTDEPRAMVISMGDSPTPIGPGPLLITSSGTDASVGGWVVYTQEKEPKQPKK